MSFQQELEDSFLVLCIQCALHQKKLQSSNDGGFFCFCLFFFYCIAFVAVK